MSLYNLEKKVIRIIVLMTGIIVLSGCGKQQKDDRFMTYEKQIYDETVSDEEELPFGPVFDSSVSISPEIPEEDISMPEIEEHSSYVEVTIRNDEEYKAFVNMLNDFTKYDVLELNMSGTDTTVFLDEILEHGNFTYLELTDGGFIAIKNKDDFKGCALESLSLYNVSGMEKDLLNYVSVSQWLRFELGDGYAGDVPVKELLDKTDCGDVIILSYKEGEECLRYEEGDVSGQEDIFSQMPDGDEGILRKIHELNEGDYSYTSYEFYEQGSDRDVCAVYISVTQRREDDEKSTAVLHVPQDRYFDMGQIDLYKPYIWIEDVNFDGYEDICFFGGGEVILCIFVE